MSEKIKQVFKFSQKEYTFEELHKIFNLSSKTQTFEQIADLTEAGVILPTWKDSRQDNIG